MSSSWEKLLEESLSDPPEIPICEKVARIVGSPSIYSYKPTEDDWNQCEENLNLRLPPTYKDLVSTFGVGTFGGYFQLFSPVELPGACCFCREYMTDFLLYQADHPNYKELNFYPKMPGIIPWCDVSARERFCWDTSKNDDPDLWPIVLLESRDVIEFKMNVPTFLIASFKGEIKGFRAFPPTFKPEIEN